MKDQIRNVNGLDCFVSGFGQWATGLRLPIESPSVGRRLRDAVSVLPMDEIRRITDSEHFTFGEKLFGPEWTTNQNGYGSCSPYAGCGAMSKKMFIRGMGVLKLSGDYLYSLVNGGRDRGSLLDETMRAMMARGVALRDTVGLGKIYRRHYNTTVADAEALRFRGHELFEVSSEQEMATALALKMPVVIAIHVTNRWRQFDSENVLAECNGVGNHAEHLDDIRYSARRGCFLYRKCTSHGINYNPDHGGYCWTLWDDHYKVSSRHHKFYAVPASLDDPQGDNPPIGEYQPPPTPEMDVSIVMETAASCHHCRRWEKEVQPKCEAEGWVISKMQPTGGPIPDFTLRVGSESVSHLGFWSFEEIRDKVSSLS